MTSEAEAAGGDERVRTFQRGESIEVPVGKIEAELTALWRAASQQKSGEPVVRACLWNLVVRVAGDQPFTYAKQLIDEVSAHVPARVIVWRDEPDGNAGEIVAWVEANWRQAGGHGLSGSDEVPEEFRKLVEQYYRSLGQAGR